MISLNRETSMIRCETTVSVTDPLFDPRAIRSYAGRTLGLSLEHAARPAPASARPAAVLEQPARPPAAGDRAGRRRLAASPRRVDCPLDTRDSLKTSSRSVSTEEGTGTPRLLPSPFRGTGTRPAFCNQLP
jgi:hypothetical protein